MFATKTTHITLNAAHCICGDGASLVNKGLHTTGYIFGFVLMGAERTDCFLALFAI